MVVIAPERAASPSSHSSRGRASHEEALLHELHRNGFPLEGRRGGKSNAGQRRQQPRDGLGRDLECERVAAWAERIAFVFRRHILFLLGLLHVVGVGLDCADNGICCSNCF